MINEIHLIDCARKMESKWYSGPELTKLWGQESAPTLRRSILPHLKKRDMIRTRGMTSLIRYKVMPESAWQVDRRSMDARYAVEPTGNGVIDAKLRKEAELPALPSSLENLITAATELGSDNEILRGKLIRIRAILDEV